MADLNSAFAAQPSALANPVPAEPDQLGPAANASDINVDANNMVNQQRANKASAAGLEAPTGNPFEQTLNDTNQMPNPFEQALGALEPQGQDEQELVEPEPGFFEANFTLEGIKNQLELLPARAKASFGKTPRDRQNALENYLGKDNVKVVGDDEFQVKLPGKDKFQKFDLDTFELVTDLVGDLFRDTIVGGAGTLAAAGATLGQGPAILEPVSTIGAGTAAFGLGVSAGAVAADILAERAFGITRDPSRPEGITGRTTEALQEGALAATFKGLGDKISKSISDRAIKRAGLKELKEIPNHEVLKDSVLRNIETMDELKNLNAIKNLPGSDMPVLAHQLLPGVDDADTIAQGLKNTPAFEKAQQLAIKNMDDTVVDMLETNSNLATGQLRKVITTGTKNARPELQQKVSTLMTNVRRSEGKVIEKFRVKAGAMANNTPIKAPKTAEALGEIVEELGVQPNAKGGFDFMPDEDLAGILGTDSKLLINGFKSDIGRMLKKSQAGGVLVDDLIRESKLIGLKNQSASKVNGKLRAYVGKLSSSLRSDLREAMPQLLDEADAKAYEGAIKGFRQSAESMDTLKNLLKQDSMATNTFVKGIINKGRGGLDQFRAAKDFLLKEDPDLWKEVTSEFFEELALKHRVAGKGNSFSFNVKAMRKELGNLGDEYMKELMPGKQSGLVLRTLDLAEQLNSTILKGTDNEVEQVAKSVFGAASQFISAKLNAVYALGKFGTADNRLMKLMARDGVEKFLERVPKAEKNKMRIVLESILKNGQVRGAIQGVTGTGREAVKAGATVNAASEMNALLNGTGLEN